MKEWLMLNRTRTGVIVAMLAVVVALIGHRLFAQASPDPDDQLLLSTLNQLAVAATDACQALPAVKQYETQRERIQARLEAKHPGYVIDYTKWILIPKPPAKPGG
jgi:hypothetical protein